MRKLKIGVLYLLLGAGGLWHVLDVFQGIMRILAAPMMFGLAVWLFWECWQVCPQQRKRPLIDGVPVCIGCAWFVMLISSVAVFQTIARESVAKSTIKLALCVALLMVVFDLFMEPAAGMLDYWIWMDDHIPLQNYLAWFGLSFIFVIIGIKAGVFSQLPLSSNGWEPLPGIAFHLYVAQLVYFALVDLKSL